jgi:hypothetical protein
MHPKIRSALFLTTVLTFGTSSCTEYYFSPLKPVKNNALKNDSGPAEEGEMLEGEEESAEAGADDQDSSGSSSSSQSSSSGGGAGVPVPATSLLINVNRVELIIDGQAPEIVKKDITVDFYLLMKNVLGVLGVALPEGKTVLGVRLITTESGHKAYKNGVAVCKDGLQIPGGSDTGIKLSLDNPLKVEANKKYLLTGAATNSKEPLHTTGNNRDACNMHPSYVIKVN